MWNHKVQCMWQPISVDICARIRRGDILAPSLPVSKNSLLYTVVNINQDGSFDLISKPVSFSTCLFELVAGTIIKPEKLLKEKWWYLSASHPVSMSY